MTLFKIEDQLSELLKDVKAFERYFSDQLEGSARTELKIKIVSSVSRKVSDFHQESASGDFSKE